MQWEARYVATVYAMLDIFQKRCGVQVIVNRDVDVARMIQGNVRYVIGPLLRKTASGGSLF